jgi:moderate conductance mechanosensitive channel
MFEPRTTVFQSFRFLRILLSVLLLVATFGAAGMLPVAAQDAEPAATTEETTQAASPELQLLIEALRNDESRNRLLEELEAVAGEVEPGPVETIDEALFGTSETSLGRRIAETTRFFAENAAESAAAFANQLSAAPRMFSALDADQIDVLWQALRDLALVIVATYAIFVTLRSFAKGYYRSMGIKSASATLLQRIVFIVVSALLDVLVVVVAWAAGYIIALTVFGEMGTIGLRQTLYLNAFLIVELAKVILRIVLSPSAPELRLLPVSNNAAMRMNRGFTWIISILGYGQLLLLPIFNQSVSLAAGQAISALVALIALLIAVGMTLSNRQRVADWLLDTPEDQPRSRHVRFLAHRWHWPVLLYLAFLFVIVLASPAGVLLTILAASGQILLAVIIGFMVSNWIARAIARGISLPERLNQRLPLLERRLNAFVPKLLTVIRGLIFLAVLLFVLDTINFFDLQGWMQSQVGVRTTAAIISVFFILIFAFAAWLALNSWVDYRLNPDYGRPATSREQTLLSLLRNAATIAILVIGVMFALSEIGINIAPLIASAGVLGLAIGFGAQKLVQDIITGVFIQLENAVNVGDVITVAATTGTVERLTIRSVSLRDVEGAYHIIPFSSVDMVTNFMRGFAYHVGDIGIGYRENVAEAQEAIIEAFARLRGDPEIAPSIIGDMEWFGVQSLADSAVIVRVRIKTVPGKQWAVGRAFNGQIKKIFDERDIEIPFPHQTLFFGVDKKGNAPAAHIQLENVASGGTAAPAATTDGATSAPSKEVTVPRRRKRQIIRDDVPDDEEN